MPCNYLFRIQYVVVVIDKKRLYRAISKFNFEI